MLLLKGHEPLGPNPLLGVFFHWLGGLASGSFYVPFRVAVHDDRGPNGGIISYDRPSSFLAALNRPELDAIGKSLDEKLDRVISNLDRQ